MIGQAADAGVRYVSLEFLKLPIESRSGIIDEISEIIGYSLRDYYEAKGMFQVGPDVTLGTPHKLAFLREARAFASKLSVSVGAGDTELIHLSDGAGCCNGSSLFLHDSNVFDANFTGILKERRKDGLFSFDDLKKKWSPTRPVSTYLMTDSRLKSRVQGLTEWQSLMAQRWEKGRSVYSPLFFAGVTDSGQRDAEGRTIYRYESPV